MKRDNKFQPTCDRGTSRKFVKEARKHGFLRKMNFKALKIAIR